MNRRPDPFVVSVVVLVVLGAAGLGSVSLAWRGLAASTVAADQLPYAISGALGGVALLGLAVGLLGVQAGRRARARELAQLARLSHAATGVLAALRANPREPGS